MISVIVPVYNVSKYLDRCISSICNQKYTDLEIILVDDGSSDDSGIICDKYAFDDARITVIHKENGGATSARKMGLQVANGEFIGFVDADDWIEPEFYEKMIKLSKLTDSDIISSGHYHDIGDYGNKIFDSFDVGLYYSKDLIPKMLCNGDFFEYGVQPHLVTKLFKKDIVVSSLMKMDDSIVIGEDAAVVYGSLLAADKVFISDICCYHYVQRSESVTKQENTRPLTFYIKQFDYLENLFKSKNVWNLLQGQVLQYEKYIILMHQMELFGGEILFPYGGINDNSRVIIYGAGVFGKKMYSYLKNNTNINICMWVDKAADYYKKQEMDVHFPEEILRLDKYDYIIVANTKEQTAKVIIDSLIKLGVNKERIRWLSKGFIESKNCNLWF